MVRAMVCDWGHDFSAGALSVVRLSLIIRSYTKTLLPWPVIDSMINLVLDAVPSSSRVARPYVHAGVLLLTVQVLHVSCLYYKRQWTLSKNRAVHVKLIHSYHVSNLLKTLHSFSNTPSDTRFCGHVITSYLCILINWYEITKFILWEFVSIKNQTFLWKFYTVKVWSYTVAICIYIVYCVGWVFAVRFLALFE